MGISGGPSKVTTGLALSLDAANFKSFRGVPATNTLPSPTVNAYPTVGNGWGTYNTNQYNNNQYFSIGTISSVTSNIVTTSTSHPLRTYDVVTPQTTGGGVTAGTNYFVKKISNTQFSLHAYNSSQDGTQGFINSSTGNHKVYDSIANDTRVSINSTSFPTMWWGPPHLPNSGLVKELITGGFYDVIPGITSDCIRQHYIRADDVKDGMAYNVDASTTAGVNHTVSFYVRSPDERAVGKTISYQIYNYTGGSATFYSTGFTLGPVGVWQRVPFTFTPNYANMISYWFSTSNGVYSWDWACMQVETGSYATPFVAGTRGTGSSTGGGWVDLTTSSAGNLYNGVQYTSASFGAISFDGVNDYISIDNNSSLQVGDIFTISAWINPSILTSRHGIFSTRINNTTGCWQLEVGTGNGGTNRVAVTGIGTWIWDSSNNVIETNKWYNICFVKPGNGTTGGNMYINGSLITPLTTTAYTIANNNDTKIIGFGTLSTQYFSGSIANVELYNRALSNFEVLQNFNATRTRFGI
jgi:hypothetical protein